jgi:hypothetical protein
MMADNQSALAQFELTPWPALPTMPIYMEQLLQLVNQILAPLGIPEVTKTMVNSYVKQHFFSRPIGRQYTRNQIVAVIVVTILKQDFDLTTISRAILKIRDSRAIEPRYQQFKLAFERALRLQPLQLTPADSTAQAIELAAQTVGAHLLTTQRLS